MTSSSTHPKRPTLIAKLLVALLACVVSLATVAPAGAQDSEVFTSKTRVRTVQVAAMVIGDNPFGDLPGNSHWVEIEFVSTAGVAVANITVHSAQCADEATNTGCEDMGTQTISQDFLGRVRIAKDRSVARVDGTVGDRSVDIEMTAADTPYKVRETTYFERDGLFTKSIHTGRSWPATAAGHVGDLVLDDVQPAAGHFERLTHKIITNDPTDDIPDNI